MYQITTATKKVARLKKRVRAIAGGTGASKTISILLWIIDYAQTHDDKIISVVSETIPHLKRGAMRDFLNIMKAHNYYEEQRWNRGDSIYYFENGTILEFFSADQSEKLRGGRRDVLFINEANNLTSYAYNELEIRTREIIFLDWNPTNLFWFYEEVQPHNDVEFITLTYRDNETLEQSIIDSIEKRKITNPNWYRVYGLGLIGNLEGLIYTNWQDIDEIPKDAKLIRRGLDFGFTNDPSALIDLYQWNGGFILDEIFYATGLSNKQIADLIPKIDNDVLVIADSAEPKSIAEIKGYGVWITGSTKGQGSVNQGIQLVQDQQLWVTKRSVNLKKDLRNYQWKKDKSGKNLNVPEHEFSHSPDAVRYAITDVLGGNLITSDDIFL